MLLKFSEDLFIELELRCRVLEEEVVHDELWLKAFFVDVDSCLERLSQFVLAHPFKNEEQEIFYYKLVRPKFVAVKIFFQERFQMELLRPIGTRKTVLRFYRKELLAARRPFALYGYYWGYFRSGQTALDHLYFLPDAKNPPVLVPEFPDVKLVDMTPCGYLFAKFIAFQRLQEYLLFLISHKEERKLSPSVKDVEAVYGEEKVVAKEKKRERVRFNLSVDQIGLSLRAAFTVGLISSKSFEALCRDWAPGVSSVEKEEVSAASLRSNSYLADDNDKLVLVSGFRKMIRFIEES